MTATSLFVFLDDLIKASILAIGTELTQGQVTNRNATWLSAKLTEMNINVSRHVTVADEHLEILQVLRQLEQESHIILVTGGLGPTTDDFTRDVLSKWSGLPLQYDEASWKWIEDRMGALGIPVAESNRQQCYFPKGSVIYPNPKGSARGFAFQKDKCAVFVFPGPPHELECVWDHGAGADLAKKVPSQERVRLFRWGVVGRSEAELGENVERILRGSGLQTGYRAHAPYVEVKVWCEESALADKKVYLEELDRYLTPHVLVKDGEDLAELFLGKLLMKPSQAITIIDGATSGLLSERILQTLRKPVFRPLFHSIEIITQPRFEPKPVEGVFAIWDVKPTGEWKLAYGLEVMEVKSPYVKPQMEERNRRYIAEMSLYHWMQHA